nr:MAG TPA: hypothetical protein [Caudoviricetes sp.]
MEKIMDDEYVLEKFPAFLKQKIQSGDVVLPTNTKFEYDKILAYRCIAREDGDCTKVNRKDMRSYYELGKIPRGVDRNSPTWYAASLNKNKRDLENVMHFPRPKKRIAKGYVYQEGGPQESEEGNHINWWLYSCASFDEFVILEG